jgi:hypothetical protein
VLLRQYLQERRLLRPEPVRGQRQQLRAHPRHLQQRQLQHRHVWRAGQGLLHDRHQHQHQHLDGNPVHRTQHQVLVGGLRPVRQRRGRGLLQYHALDLEQLDLDHLHRRRPGVRRYLHDLGLFHLRRAGTALLSGQQVRRQRLLLQRNVRGGRDCVRQLDHRLGRQHGNQPGDLQRRQVLRLRRCQSGMLRDHLRRGSRLSQQHLLSLRRRRRAVLLGRQWRRPLRGGLGLLDDLVLVHRHLPGVRRNRRPMLRRQHLRERMLLRRLLSRRGHRVHQLVEHRHLRHLQVGPLHLRQRQRALLPDRRPA